MRYLRVPLREGDDGVDLPELTSIRLGRDVCSFSADKYESFFVMHGYDSLLK